MYLRGEADQVLAGGQLAGQRLSEGLRVEDVDVAVQCQRRDLPPPLVECQRADLLTCIVRNFCQYVKA